MRKETVIRKFIVFRGWVQGVGFRWRARHAAGLVGATGWVKNEDDGSVSMEIQGSAEQIDKVLQILGSDRYIDITGTDIKSLPVEEDERRFIVR